MITQEKTNRKQYDNFLGIYRQIAKNNPLLSQRYYPEVSEWATACSIISLQKYVREQQKLSHNSLQLQIQKLFMQMRQITYEFVIRGINIVKSICKQNVGVLRKQQNSSFTLKQTKYRQSLGPTFAYDHNSKMTKLGSQNYSRVKLEQTSEFKLYIDFQKCGVIEGEQNIGRMIIESEKLLMANFREQIQEMVMNISEESSNQEQYFDFKRPVIKKKALSVNDKKIEGYQIPQPKKADQMVKGLEFTGKKRRKKKVNSNPPISGEPPPKIRPNDQQKTDASTKIYTSIVSQPQQISKRVLDTVQKSRQQLKIFRQKFLINK